MTLRAYLRILAERWRIIAIFLVAAVAVALGVTLTAAKVYQAQVQIFVVAAATSDPGMQYQGSAFTQLQVQTFARIVKAPDVLHRVEQDLDLPMSDAELAGKITASAPTGQSIVNLQVQDSSPARSAQIANSAAQAFVAVVEGYYAPDGKAKNSTLRMHITDPATAPTSPVSPKPVLNFGLAILLGLLVGAAVAVARDILDNRIKDVAGLRKASGVPTMGVVVEDAATERNPVAARSGSPSARAENYRQLRANLQFANVDEHPRVIAVTSAVPGEGKTTVAINLAAAMAEAGFTVCLVDADLRRPGIARAFGLVGPVGLTSLLVRQVELGDAIQSAGENLFVLASGPTPPNPSEVLASTYVRGLVRSLLDRVDYVVLDTAPVLPVADGSEVAALADGTLLVARYQVTTDDQVTRATDVLRQLDVVVLGTVLNRVPPKGRTEYGYARERDAERSRHARDAG